MKNDKEGSRNNNQQEGEELNPAERIADLMDRMMIYAIVNTACFMMTKLMFNSFPRQMEHMREALKREPTVEDWEDLVQAWGERVLNPKYLRRADDREKIRRMVFELGTNR